jgi:hypothetical protein
MAMSYWGKVSKGTVVLPPGANLPEGTEVRVEPVAPKTLAERLKDVIGTVHGGPPDWYDEWFIREVEKGLAAADRGEFIEHEEIGKLIDRRYPG